tara:strand:- start:970 stop:1143 length:174 start_codon:yes stop_codon:yes gene_type:complete
MIINNKNFKWVVVLVFIVSFILYNVYNNKKVDNEFEVIQDDSESVDEQLKRLMILNN